MSCSLRNLWRRTGIVAALPVVVLISAIGSTIAQAQNVGDKVVVIAKGGADLRIEHKKVDHVMRGMEATVEKTQGDWLKVSDGGESGWLKLHEVVPAEQAVEHFTACIEKHGTSDGAAERAEDYVARGWAWNRRKDPDIAIADHTAAIDDLQFAVDLSKPKLTRDISYEEDSRGSERLWAIRIDSSDTAKFRKMAEEFNAKVARMKFLAYASRAEIYYDIDKYEQAIADYSYVINKFPAVALARLGRGKCFFFQDKYELAVTDFNEAIRLDSKKLSAYYMRGQSFAKQADHQRAVTDFSYVIRQQPDADNAIKNRAMSFIALGQYDAALLDHQKLLELKKDDPSVYNSLAWFACTFHDAKARNGKLAVENAKRAVELAEAQQHKSLSCYIDTLAAAYAEVGDFTNAVATQRRAVELAPDSEKTEYQSRLSLFMTGKPYHEPKPGHKPGSSDPHDLPPIELTASKPAAAVAKPAPVVVEEEQPDSVVLRLTPAAPATGK